MIHFIRTNNIAKIKDSLIKEAFTPNSTVMYYDDDRYFPLLSFAVAVNKPDVVNLLLTYKGNETRLSH